MTKVEMFENLQGRMLELYKNKNADYGDSFGNSFREFGEISALVRLSDKFERIKSLVVGKGQKVMNESINDTLMDTANYATMWLIERELANGVSPSHLDKSKNVSVSVSPSQLGYSKRETKTSEIIKG